MTSIDRSGRSLKDWGRSIVTAFQQRRLWAAVLLALVFPPMAMLYLGRGRLAFLYFIMPFLLKAGFLFIAFTATVYIDLEFVRDLPAFIVYVVGIIHVIAIAEMLRGEAPQVWYARWPAVLGLGYLAPILLSLLLRTLFEGVFGFR